MASGNTEDLFDKALELIKGGKNREAFELLKKLVDNIPSSIFEIEARYLSYYGYLTGVVGHDYQRGIELCNEAIRKEFFHPDFYVNLGRLYLAINNKGMAVKVFYKGLRIDRTDQELLKEVKKLGIRKEPIFPFIKRGNPINKSLGRVRALLNKMRKGGENDRER
ncbi:MAG: hypothetical protein M1491_08475 [Deltaproteobacteria bacterium]|nr:hypothetical protein [Deltaproteobacteria bacterium]MCL5277712.1 hypothetical protein [Deltaproteobacteria bacterium]